MRLMRTGGLAVLLVVVSSMAVGCADKEKKELAALRTSYDEVCRQNNDLRGQLSQCKAREADLLAQVDAKDQQLAAKEQELNNLRAKGPATAGPKTEGTAEGWEKGLTADRVTLGTDILFDAGKATLTAAGQRKLDEIGATLKSQYAGKIVRVYGYTDSDPIRKTKNLWQDNLDLSANRAMAVTRYLQGKGIKADLIETVAMGETHAVASNASSAGKTKNRRVEIIVLK